MFRPREAKPIARKHVCFPCSDTTEIKIITTLNMKQKMKKLQGLPKTNIYIYIYTYWESGTKKRSSLDNNEFILSTNHNEV